MDSGTPGDGDSGVLEEQDSGMPVMDSGMPQMDAGNLMRAMPPPLPTYSGGTCPAWPTDPAAIQYVDGGTVTTVTNFMTHGVAREFKIVIPRNYDPSHAYPLVFVWHWLNASANSAVTEGQLSIATEQLNFIAIAPEHKMNSMGNKVYQFSWPFVEATLDPNGAAAQEELNFLDDMIACASANNHIDPARIHTMGASAGALWADYVMMTPHADHIASLVSISGGLASLLGVFDMEYAPQTNKYPALVLWGGPTDSFILDFNAASIKLRDALVADNHFVVTCTHMSGHGLPPIPDPPDGGSMLAPMYEFLMDHPYGLPPKTSPYQQTGLGADYPSWCEIYTP